MLAVLTSHPIQYQAPLWRAMAAAGIDFETWFLTPHAVVPTLDREFGTVFAWDEDLTDGYPNRFLEIEESWSMNRFNGIKLKSNWKSEFIKHNVTHLWVEGWRFAENWKAIAAAHSLGLKVILRGETNDLRAKRTLRDIPRNYLLRKLFKKVDYFLAIGSANRRFYAKMGVAPKQISPAPYCVDNDKLQKQVSARIEKRDELRARWGIHPEATCILFCGKLIPKKRPLDLVDAVKTLDRVHLLFVGSGELHANVSQKTTRPEIETQHNETKTEKPLATLAGFLNQGEIVDAYIAADILVLPSDAGETWGLVVNEAMACGLPAVVSNRCGSAEDLTTSPKAIFECGDIDDLRKAIELMISDPPNKGQTLTKVDGHHLRHTVNTVSDLLNR